MLLQKVGRGGFKHAVIAVSIKLYFLHSVLIFNALAVSEFSVTVVNKYRTGSGSDRMLNSTLVRLGHKTRS